VDEPRALAIATGFGQTFGSAALRHPIDLTKSSKTISMGISSA
jgi:hypothetical protein